MKSHVKKNLFKNIHPDFRSIEKQVRSVENASIDPEPIEHRSKQPETFLSFLKHFRSVENQLRSIEILEKSHF